MLADIEAGKVGTVIVKDMSRLGRNYLQVGMYTEMLFPQKGVRFIAVHDNVDSTDEGIGNDFMPLKNLFKQWADNGLAFSRTTMENWVIRCSQDWLSLVYDRMHKELLSREILHADETPVQVLKESDRAATSKSYMWVYRTGKVRKMPVVLYDYRSGRNGEYPKELLNGFHGYLHTDGYAGYNKVEDITRCGCWAHVRRKFIEAIPANAAGLGGPLSSAEAGCNYCDQLFAAEKKIEELPEEKRQAARLEAQPVYLGVWRIIEKDFH